MKKYIILLFVIANFFVLCSCASSKDKEVTQKTIPFAYIYNYNDEALFNKIEYTGDFEYLNFPYFSKRLALPVRGEFCDKPLTSQDEIKCEVLSDDIYYYDINSIIKNISDDMFVSVLSGGYDIGETIYFNETDFYEITKNHEILPIPAIYTRLDPFTIFNQYDFDTHDAPSWKKSNTYELKTSNNYELDFCYIEIDEAYLMEIHYYYVLYPKPVDRAHIYAYGYIPK